MEQEDYLLREIEKTGIVLKMIFNKLAGNNENSANTVEYKIADAKAILLSETGFDVNLFLSLKDSETEQYIFGFQWSKGSNTELLADIFKITGMETDRELSKICLQRALQLYELCNSSDKTFSFERESKISELKNYIKSASQNRD
jgi:phosphorylcholine metabolism protein LicD